jgi:hypothetical protein
LHRPHVRTSVPGDGPLNLKCSTVRHHRTLESLTRGGNSGLLALGEQEKLGPQCGLVIEIVQRSLEVALTNDLCGEQKQKQKSSNNRLLRPLQL